MKGFTSLFLWVDIVKTWVIIVHYWSKVKLRLKESILPDWNKIAKANGWKRDEAEIYACDFQFSLNFREY